MVKVKDKERVLKAAREKQPVTYQGKTTQVIAHFSAQNLQSRKVWHDIFKMLKENYFKPTIHYPTRLLFRV